MTDSSDTHDLHNHLFTVKNREEALSLEDCTVYYLYMECKGCDEEVNAAEAVGETPKTISDFCDVAYEFYQVAHSEDTHLAHQSLGALTDDLHVPEWGTEWTPIYRLLDVQELAREDAYYDRERDYDELIPEILHLIRFPRLYYKYNDE